MPEPKIGMIARSPWWVPWIFILLVMAGWAYSQSSVGGVAQRNQEARVAIRDAELESCERNNLLRAELNERSVVLRESLAVSAAVALAVKDKGSADEYLQLASKIRDVGQVDCDKAYPEDAITAGVGGL